jgi:hypothetical protein
MTTVAVSSTRVADGARAAGLQRVDEQARARL